MTDDKLDGFISSMLADERSRAFSTVPDDGEILRVAIELRAIQGEYAWPERQFVETLHQHLAVTTQGRADLLPFPSRVWRRDDTEVVAALAFSRRRPQRKAPRLFDAVVKTAAAVLLGAATFTATKVVAGHGPAPAAQHVADAFRSGTLLAADGRRLGESYAYNASPSWMFMDVQNSGLGGTYKCDLRLANGKHVTAGVLVVYQGSGEWAHTVSVDVSQVREAMLETPAGEVVATATFS